jgi:hypothetical protein
VSACADERIDSGLDQAGRKEALLIKTAGEQDLQDISG